MVDCFASDKYCFLREGFNVLLGHITLRDIIRWLRSHLVDLLNIALLYLNDSLLPLLWLLQPRWLRDRALGAHRGIVFCELLAELFVVDSACGRTDLQLFGCVFLRLLGLDYNF